MFDEELKLPSCRVIETFIQGVSNLKKSFGEYLTNSSWLL